MYRPTAWLILLLGMLLGVLTLTSTLGVEPARAWSSANSDTLAALDARVRALEDEVARLRQEVAAPVPTVLAPPVVRPSGRESALAVGGLVQVQGEFLKRGDLRYTSRHDRVLLRRARLNATAGYLEDYEARIEIELAGSVTETSGLRAQLTDGFVGWNRFRALNVRVGQFKTPFGAEQLIVDQRLNAVERSLTSDRLTLGRQIGGALQGELQEGRLTYALGAFNGTGTNTSANDNDGFLVAGRLTCTPWVSARKEQRWTLGVNGYRSSDAATPGQPAEFRFDSTPGGSADNIFAGHRHGVGLDTQIHWRRVDLRAEFLRSRFEPANELPAPRLETAGASVELAVASAGRRWVGVVRADAYQPDMKRRAGRITSLMLGVVRQVKGDDLKLQFGFNQVFEERDTPYDNRLILRLQSIY